MNKTNALNLVWGASLLLVTVFSIYPGSPHPQLLSNIDKLQHLLAYAWLAFIPALLYGQAKLFPILIATALWGVVLESIQIFVPYRDPSFGDVAANTIGVVLGTFLGVKVVKRVGRGNTRSPSNQV